MNPLTAALRRAADDLDRSGRRWALVGGFAVSARVEPRFTSDVDMAVMVDDDEAAERLVAIEPEIAQAAETLDITAGLRLPVATVGHLIALKILARDDTTRPQDLADLQALLAVASSTDLAMAWESVGLIETRVVAPSRTPPARQELRHVEDGRVSHCPSGAHVGGMSVNSAATLAAPVGAEK